MSIVILLHRPQLYRDHVVGQSVLVQLPPRYPLAKYMYLRKPTYLRGSAFTVFDAQYG